MRVLLVVLFTMVLLGCARQVIKPAPDRVPDTSVLDAYEKILDDTTKGF